VSDSFSEEEGDEVISNFENANSVSMFTNNDDKPWIITATDNHNGHRSFMAPGDLDHDENSGFSLATSELPGNTGLLKFWVKCSTE
jgi:hypothetical protein